MAAVNVRPMALLLCSLSLLVQLLQTASEQSQCDHLSLLQSSFYIDKPEAPATATEYGFPQSEEEIMANRGDNLIMEDSAVYRQREAGLYTHADTRARKLEGQLQLKIRILMDRLKAQEDKSESGSWSTILIVSLLGCSIIGFAIYIMVAGGQPSDYVPEALSAVGKEMTKEMWKLEEMAAHVMVAEKSENGEVSDVAIMPPVDLDADTYGMGVCSLTRDSYFMAHEGYSKARILRLVVTAFLVVVTIVIQVFLLAKVKQFVSARAVHDIREAYDTYEVAMYGEENCTLTVNGKHRGIPGFMPPLEEAMKRLNGLKEDDRDSACRIPLSQPHFFGVILLIWTLTCMHELKKAINLQWTIVFLETVPTMGEAMRQGDDENSESDGVIKGMTVSMKVLITVIMFIPRILVTCYLLYVGCRWLLATTDFADLIMNAVALEFILLIKDVIHATLMPARSELDLSLTKIEPYPKEMQAGWTSSVSSLVLLAIANFWVFMYMSHWQAVLPEYKWDVHDVCVQYIKERYAV